MNIAIFNDIDNPKLEGFFLESNGNEMTARRINRWQFDVTTESWRGVINTEYSVSCDRLKGIVEMWLTDDDRGCYYPHFPATKWTEGDIERFMNKLCPTMCDPFFRGFTLTADDAEPYKVEKHSNRIEWIVDGRVTDFSGVLRATRKKLNEEHMWKFTKI